VPQISVLLDRLSPEHLDMVRFWLGWWLEQRDVLLDGALEPLLPQHLYPVIRASTDAKRVVAVYADGLAPLGTRPPQCCWVVNGTRRNRVILECEQDAGRRLVTVRDCCGRAVSSATHRFTMGVHPLAVPPAGLLELTG
jgi:alpha-galactosidase